MPAALHGKSHRKPRIPSKKSLIPAPQVGFYRKVLLSLHKQIENAMTKNHNCEQFPMRRRYDRSPKSLIGRFWRWHIGFCPGWKAYFLSLGTAEQEELRTKYNFNKY